MSENPIAISNINDFVFCPVSIYFHMLDYNTDNILLQDAYQLNGLAAHEKIDSGEYSDRTGVFQAIEVYCEKYNLYGKIDVFDSRSGLLTERKNKILKIYDGYVFQLYAQYFALVEMGYDVLALRLYSMSDNKVYPVLLPQHDSSMLQKFESVICEMKTFRMDSFKQTNPEKCVKCIYEPLCSFAIRR